MNREHSKLHDTGLLQSIAKSVFSTLVSSVSGSTLTGKVAGGGGDFDVAYTSISTITASNLPASIAALASEDILSVIQYDSDGNFMNVFTKDTSNITVAANVITVGGADFDATDTFVVATNYAASGSGTSGGTSSGRQADFKIGTQDGTVTFTSAATITLGGAYPTITNDSQIVYIFVVDAAGTSAIYINGDGTHTMTHAAGVITIAGATPFVVGDQYEVGISTLDIGDDFVNNAVMTSELSPAKTNYTNSETLVSEVDQVNATTNRYIFDVSDSGYRFWSMHYKVFADTADDTVTMTLWATNNDDADDTADTDWIDVTNDIIGAASIATTNTTVENLIIYDVTMPVTRVMVKLVYVYGGGGSPNSSVDIYLVRTN